MSDVFVMASDANIVVPLGVAVADLGRLVPRGSRLVIIQQGIGAADQRWLQDQAGPTLDLEILEVVPESIQGIELPAHLPPATLFRLLVGELLDPELERAVYLDVDVLIREDPTPLFAASTTAIAAARDTFRPWVAGRPELPWRDLGVDPATAYFNAGVLVIGLQRWREERIGARCLALLRDHAMPYGDQDALNLVVAGGYASLPPRWNVQTDLFRDVALGWTTADRETLEAAVQDPAIVHFTGPVKPWHDACANPFATEWRRSLARTARASWRPPQPSRMEASVSRARRRLARIVSGG